MMPKAEKVKELPAPSRTDEEIQNAANQQRAKIVGEASGTSWLTGGMGVPSRKVMTAAQLLGG